MGKKPGRPEDEPDRKKREKAKPAPAREPLMVGVERCPPTGRLVFEWVVGNGLGRHAAQDAQRAYERAYELRMKRAEEKARQADATDPQRRCTLHRSHVVGPFAGHQSWRFEDDDEVPRATTWNWVGFVVLEEWDAA